MNNIIANIRTQLQKLKCRIANLSKRVTYIEDNCCNGSGGDGIQSIVPGDNISVDNTDSVNPIVSAVFDVDIDHLIEVTYSELVDLVITESLTPGIQYRITDYVTKTNSDEDWYMSAEHPFDIIVVADSNKELNHFARATYRAGDTYFPKSSKLESWELSYDINNDKSLYSWADGINGKGVIYRMKDNNNNDIPYDFKNIKYKRYKCLSVTNNRLQEYIGEYVVADLFDQHMEADESDFKFLYTFEYVTSGEDASIKESSGRKRVEVAENKMMKAVNTGLI